MALPLVGTASTGSYTSGTSRATSLPTGGPLAKGDVLRLVMEFDGDQTTSAVATSGSTTWTKTNAVYSSPINTSVVEFIAAYDPAGVAGVSVAPTVTWGGASIGSNWTMDAYRGYQTAGYVAGTPAKNTTQNTAPTCPAVTTPVASCLVLTNAVTYSGGTFTPNASLTLAGADGSGNHAMYATVGAAGTYGSYANSCTNNTYWLATTLALKPAGIVVSAPTGMASATGVTPTPQWTLGAPTGSAGAAAPTPSPQLAAAAPTATAAAAGEAPTLQWVLLAPTGLAAAVGIAPTVTGGGTAIVIAAPTATVVASGIPPTIPPPPGPSPPGPSPIPTSAQTVSSPFRYIAFDLLSGVLLGQCPMRGVQFGQQLNTPGQAQFTLDLTDPRVLATNPIGCTIPNRTLIVIDLNGALVWGGIVQTRKWTVDSSGQAQRTLAVQAVEVWSYFQQRVQATDYSAPPYSGMNPSGMPYWTQTPWDAGLIACQVIADAIGYTDSAASPYTNLLGGISILYNGEPPNGAAPVVPAGNYVAVSYPYTSVMTVDTIVSQLTQLGLYTGFDIGVDLAYTAGPGTQPKATINLSYPRRGRTVAANSLFVDLTVARGYEFPEDGSQTANQVYEIGGSGALVVSENPYPLDQGYPLWERVMSRSNAQSQNIIGLLGQSGTADLAMFSYAPVAPTVTLGLFDSNLTLGEFVVGDDVQLFLPELAPDGNVFDPRFPAGLSQEWRITGWQANVADSGDATLQLTLAQPPYEQAVAAAV